MSGKALKSKIAEIMDKYKVSEQEIVSKLPHPAVVKKGLNEEKIIKLLDLIWN